MEAIAIGIVLLLAGALLGGIVSFFVNKKTAHRPTLTITFTKLSYLEAKDYGKEFSMTWSGTAVSNLVIMQLEVANQGMLDIRPPDESGMAAADRQHLRPYLKFACARVLGVRTLNNDMTAFTIPLTPSRDNRSLWINVNRITAGTRAVFHVVLTLDSKRSDLRHEDVNAFAGTLDNVDVKFEGLVFETPITIQKPLKVVTK